MIPCTACGLPAMALDVPTEALDRSACEKLGIAPETQKLVQLCAACVEKATGK